MATITIPKTGTTISGYEAVRDWVAPFGVGYEVWQAAIPFAKDADSDTILRAYDPVLKPYMQKNGYSVADVVTIWPEMPNLTELNAKFLKEHIHTEDEVRFFVEGKGDFWFHIEAQDLIFCVSCEAGDLLSVPVGAKHWFDMGANPQVKVIRIFTDPSGWVPHYTNSNIEQEFIGALR